ncbi:MAG: hypothetical protein WA937_15525 [Flavobacteriales bacterium]
MNNCSSIDAAHKSLGEFIILFQWVEGKYREIGWFIIDPERHNWPPKELRTETNQKLIDQVTDLFIEVTNTYVFENGAEKALEMQELRVLFHELRKYRNRLVHSAYVELKPGGELQGYVQSNPRVGVDPETGELLFNVEEFTAELVKGKMQEYAPYIWRLSQIHMQLIHWFPFAR